MASGYSSRPFHRSYAAATHQRNCVSIHAAASPQILPQPSVNSSAANRTIRNFRMVAHPRRAAPGIHARKDETMTVRAKLHLQSETTYEWGGKKLRFETRYDDTIPEDLRFQKATPSGHIEMQIDNPVALAQFKLGGDYYVDFTPVNAEQAKAA